MSTRPKKSYTIWCVLSDEVNPFTVEIESNKTVENLKEKIQEKAPDKLASIGARNLKLYDVTISNLGKMARDDMVALVNKKVAERPTELWAMKRLADVFKDGGKKTLIIVQDPQSGMLCVLGEWAKLISCLSR
jgi:Crinkler effector protein N-terminal domain